MRGLLSAARVELEHRYDIYVSDTRIHHEPRTHRQEDGGAAMAQRKIAQRLVCELLFVCVYAFMCLHMYFLSVRACVDKMGLVWLRKALADMLVGVLLCMLLCVSLSISHPLSLMRVRTCVCRYVYVRDGTLTRTSHLCMRVYVCARVCLTPILPISFPPCICALCTCSRIVVIITFICTMTHSCEPP